MNEQNIGPRSTNEPFWRLKRLVRSTRQELETVWVDSDFLRTCAADQRSMVIGECDIRRSANLVSAASGRTGQDSVWVVAATEPERVRLAEALGQSSGDCSPHIRGGCRDGDCRGHEVEHLLLTSGPRLRATSPDNPRRCERLLHQRCRLFVIVDTHLNLCTVPFGTTWDPAWVVRDTMARLCAQGSQLAVVILTERRLLSLNPSRVQRAFGSSGLLYFEPGAEHPRMSMHRSA